MDHIPKVAFLYVLTHHCTIAAQMRNVYPANMLQCKGSGGCDQDVHIYNILAMVNVMKCAIHNFSWLNRNRRGKTSNKLI